MPETNSNNITLSVNDGTPTVTAHLEFPGPVVLGVVTSYNATSGTVSYNRLYTTSGGDTATGDSTGTAVLPILH